MEYDAHNNLFQLSSPENVHVSGVIPMLKLATG